MSEISDLQKTVNEMSASISQLVIFLMNSKKEESPPKVSKVTKVPKGSKATSLPKTRRGPVSGKGRPNLFESMKDSIPLEKEPGWDKLNDAVPRTARRSPYKPKKMKCEECAAKVEVHPELARDNFTCDRCLTKKVKR